MQMCACTNHIVCCMCTSEAGVCLHLIVHMSWQSARSCLLAALLYTVSNESFCNQRPGTNLKAVGRQVLGLAGSCPVCRPLVRASTRDVLEAPAKAHRMSDASSASLVVSCSLKASSCSTHLHVHFTEAIAWHHVIPYHSLMPRCPITRYSQIEHSTAQHSTAQRSIA